MTNNELTLDQLTSISGGGKEEREERRAERKAARAEKKCKKAFENGPGKDGTWVDTGLPGPDGTCKDLYPDVPN